MDQDTNNKAPMGIDDAQRAAMSDAELLHYIALLKSDIAQIQGHIALWKERTKGLPGVRRDWYHRAIAASAYKQFDLGRAKVELHRRQLSENTVEIAHRGHVFQKVAREMLPSATFDSIIRRAAELRPDLFVRELN